MRLSKGVVDNLDVEVHDDECSMLILSLLGFHS